MSEIKVDFDHLGDEMARLIEEYGIQIQEKTDEVLETYANKIKDDIPNTTAFQDANHRVHLRNSFHVIKTLDEKDNHAYAIQAGTEGHKYSVVHLVEHGHRMVVKLKGGALEERGVVQPRPFLQPLVDIYAPIVTSELRKAVEEIVVGQSSTKV